MAFCSSYTCVGLCGFYEIWHTGSTFINRFTLDKEKDNGAMADDLIRSQRQ